jgi:hypothetical protein
MAPESGLLRCEVMNRSDVDLVELGNTQGFFVGAPAGGFARQNTGTENSDGYFANRVFTVKVGTFAHAAGADLLAIFTAGVVRHGESVPFPSTLMTQIVSPAERLVNKNHQMEKACPGG